jgi:CBS-domain-containing membrane protein
VSPATAVDVAVRRPTVHPSSATVGDVRRFLAGGHVHLALLVDEAGRLVSTLVREDLTAYDDATPAVEAGTLAGRVVAADLPADLLPDRMLAAGVRRMAVVDEAGVLVGLVCRKKSGQGWCTDAGIASRRAERPYAG